MIKVKDIKLKPAIGEWYEYRADQEYNTNFIFENIEKSSVNEILNLHYRFGEFLLKYLTDNLNLAAKLYEVSLSQQTYGEFLKEKAKEQLVAVTPGQQNSSPEILVSYNLAGTLISRALGGQPEKVFIKNELTEIEKIVCGQILQGLLKEYPGYWQNQLKLDLNNIQLLSPYLKENESIKKDELVIGLSLKFALGELSPEKLTILFTNKAFEQLVEQYQSRLAKNPARTTVQLLPESVTNVCVPLEVTIGSSAVAMSDLIDLREGDVFQLNEKLSDNVRVKIGDQAEFLGMLGSTLDNKFAIKMLDTRQKFLSVVETASASPTVAEVALSEATMPDTEPEASVQDVQQTDIQEEQDQLQDNFANEIADDNLPKKSENSTEDALLKEFAEQTSADNEEDSEFVWDVDDL